MKTTSLFRWTIRNVVCGYGIFAMMFFTHIHCHAQENPPATKPSPTITEPKTDPKADEALQKIVTAEQDLFQELGDLKIATTVPPAYENKILDIQKRYQEFVRVHPQHLYGKILFGKFLQKIDEPELANRQFLDANDIDPNIAVVKQQLGNYLTENGEYKLAVGYFLSAIDLDPNTAVYHYQLGELLSTYRTFFIRDEMYTSSAIDQLTQEAFANATKLDPNNRSFQVRYAESFFDVDHPDYTLASKLWDKLLQTSQNPLEQQFLLLRKTQVLIELKDYQGARNLLNQNYDVRYEKSRKSLLDKIPTTSTTHTPPTQPATPTKTSTTTSEIKPKP